MRNCREKGSLTILLEELDKPVIVNSNRHYNTIRKVRAHRISTADPLESTQAEDVNVIIESPLYIDVEGIEQYTILCTPIDKLALAAGFLFSEGIIDSMEDLALIRECQDNPDIVRIKLTNNVKRNLDYGRNLIIVSSCGACGTENFNQKLEALPKVGDSLRIESKMLKSAMTHISEKQPLFDISGGTHLVAIISSEGQILASAEDTGRHHAIDKAVGKCLFAGVPFDGSWAVFTGRVSIEMVYKCARAGIELISAISAPTSLAIEIAERCGITLCAFVRQDRATVFTHPERIIT